MSTRPGLECALPPCLGDSSAGSDTRDDPHRLVEGNAGAPRNSLAIKIAQPTSDDAWCRANGANIVPEKHPQGPRHGVIDMAVNSHANQPLT